MKVQLCDSKVIVSMQIFAVFITCCRPTTNQPPKIPFDFTTALIDLTSIPSTTTNTVVSTTPLEVITTYTTDSTVGLQHMPEVYTYSQNIPDSTSTKPLKNFLTTDPIYTRATSASTTRYFLLKQMMGGILNGPFDSQKSK